MKIRSREEYLMAKRALAGESGEVFPVEHAYEHFRYKDDKALLIFYPHKTTAGNTHIRTRIAKGSDKTHAMMLVKKLQAESGFSCTFQMKQEM